MIVAGAAGPPRSRRGPFDHEQKLSGTTAQPVASTSYQRIVAIATGKRVQPGPTDQQIGASTARQQVIARIACNAVIAVTAIQRILPLAPRKRVVASIAPQRVVADIPRKTVIAAPARDPIIAIKRRNGVCAGGAGQQIIVLGRIFGSSGVTTASVVTLRRSAGNSSGATPDRRAMAMPFTMTIASPFSSAMIST